MKAKMSNEEKKNFLSMDLIERMIRVEQRVAASFNKKLSIRETEYYKSLPENERKKFDSYLKKKKAKRFLFFFVLLIPIIFMILTNTVVETGFTGKVIGNDSLSMSVSDIIVLSAFGFIAVVFSLYLISRRKRAKYFGKHFTVLEKALAKKS